MMIKKITRLLAGDLLFPDYVIKSIGELWPPTSHPSDSYHPSLSVPSCPGL